MSTYLLDTSAVVAHFRRESGHARVQALFEDHNAAVILAAPSLLELDTVLKAKIADEAQRLAVLNVYGSRVAEVVPVDRAVALAAIKIKNASTKRLPGLDALIAGCAVVNDATLVHSDPHFDAVPAALLRTLRLQDTDEPAVSGDVPPIVREEKVRYGKTKSGTRRKR